MGDLLSKSPDTRHEETQRQQIDLHEIRERLREEIHQESRRIQTRFHRENQSKQKWMLAISCLTLLLVVITGYKDISNSTNWIWIKLKPTVVDAQDWLWTNLQSTAFDDGINEFPHWPR